MALAIAEHVPIDFIKVGEALRSDLNFMLNAVERSGKVLRFCGNNLRTHKELAIRAVANYPHALQQDGSISKQELQQFVESQLELRELFILHVLRGIAFPQHSHLPPGPPSALPMLDRGTETGTALKIVISEFLGIPVGDKLTVYRKCLNHLKNPPPMVPDHLWDEMAGMDRMARHHFMIQRMREGRDRHMDRLDWMMNVQADMLAMADPLTMADVRARARWLPAAAPARWRRAAAPANNDAAPAPGVNLAANAIEFNNNNAEALGGALAGMDDAINNVEAAAALPPILRAHLAAQMGPQAVLNDLDDDVAMMFAFERDEIMDDLFAGLDEDDDDDEDDFGL